MLQDGHAWRRGRLLVLSSLLLAEFRGELRWQWLVSVTAGGGRPDEQELRRALRDFGMERAEEDNHFPGRCRGFFLLTDLRPGEEALCECKEDEATVVEPDGFTWQRNRHVDEAEARRATEARNLAVRLFGAEVIDGR